MLGFIGTFSVVSQSAFLSTCALATTPAAGSHTARPAATMTLASTHKMPTTKPASPCFSSGPCKKRPGYVLAEALADAPLGRSHRSAVGKAKIERALALTKEVLQIPDGYRVAIVPGSDTGAVEMAMWSLLGAKPVDVCHWESFGKGWLTDAVSHLELDDVRELTVDKYGELPDLAATDKDHDIVFTWNGTTSGVRVPDGADWIADDRTGLTICDATSAVFAMRIPWPKIDVLTYSWQKVLGGEAAHGMLILSPRAVDRLESFTPNRPLPKIFRMTKGGKIDEALFEGSVINTVSMLCVEDYLDALDWCVSLGGLDALVARSEANLAVVDDFVQRNAWAHFLAADRKSRSSTSVCLYFDMEKAQVKTMEKMLAAENVAFDINSYRDAPAGLRVWCGATVEEEDLRRLMTWIEYCYSTIAEA
jgi:phosphoserine aminotransferase